MANQIAAGTYVEVSIVHEDGHVGRRSITLQNLKEQLDALEPEPGPEPTQE